MPVYQYRARTGTGNDYGTYDRDKSDVVIMLRKKGTIRYQ